MTTRTKDRWLEIVSDTPKTGDPRAADAAPEFPRPGGAYIHCGETMQFTNPGVTSIYAPVTTEDPEPTLLSNYLQAPVLRCKCGFQMDVPA